MGSKLKGGLVATPMLDFRIEAGLSALAIMSLIFEYVPYSFLLTLFLSDCELKSNDIIPISHL